jgi:hypothetical protein
MIAHAARRDPGIVIGRPTPSPASTRFPHAALAIEPAEAKVHGNSPSIEWDLWLKSRAG